MKKIFVAMSLIVAGCATAPKPSAYVIKESEIFLPHAIEVCINTTDVHYAEQVASDAGCVLPTSMPYIVGPSNCIWYDCHPDWMHK